MMVYLKTDRALFHHCQDTGTNCGRASAQMVISSLTQSPAIGSGIAPPAAATPIAVTQAALQSREADNLDNTAVPSWYTHPDELLSLLKGAPEFTAPLKHWRLANHATLDDLLADLVLALQRGMPSIININGSDHWVVVVGAGLDASGRLQLLQMRDPLPTDARSHTYIDGCSDSANGESYGDPWELSRGDLAGYDLQIGTVPPPYGMGHYAGRYIGIIHGGMPSPAALAELTKRLRPPKRPPWETAEPQLDPIELSHELSRKASEWQIEALRQLLDRNLVPNVRLVKDIEGSSSQYTLLSLFSKNLQSGLVAAFDASGTLKHFRFIKDEIIHTSLRGDPQEPLWWSRRWLPALSSPYFPFRLNVEDASPVYTRLIDGFNTSLKG